MIKKYKFMAAAVLAGMLAGVAHGKYPSMETARALFSPSNLNSTNCFYHSDAYRSFMSDICGSQLPPAEVSKEMETFIVCAITSTVVTVSTNAVDDGTPIWIIEDRGSVFWGLSLAFSNFPTNAELCLTLAHYIGTLKPVGFPTPLARAWGGPVRMALTGNKTTRPEERARRDVFEREYNARREHQVRVNNANRALLQYRSDLLRICRRAVKGCRMTMPQDKYISFTNELIRASRATKKEADMVLDSWQNNLDRTDRIEVEFPESGSL